jgi:hypothetical protein
MTAIATIECFDARADGSRPSVELASDRVVISRRVGGVEMRVALAPRQFRGVALSVLIAEETDFLYSARLIHADPDLCVTLASCGDEAEASAQWRRWAESLRLPRLVERAAGEYVLDRRGAATLPFVRRRGRATLNRRNRFLARRKMGRAELALNA